TYAVTLTARDQDGNVSQAVSQQVAIGATPQIQNGVLVVPGTAGAATIALTPTLPTGATAYSMNVSYSLGGTTTNFGPFAVSAIEVYGGPHPDAVPPNGPPSSDAFTAGIGAVSELAAQTTPFPVGLNAVTAMSFNGAGGGDSLTGPDQANAWQITGKN